MKDEKNEKGSFFYFLREPGPVGLGHMGWGYKDANDNWRYGSLENPGGKPFVPAGGPNGYWFETSTTRAQMIQRMKQGGYTAYKEVPVETPNTERAFQAATRQDGYSVVGNNCLDNAARLGDSYGAKVPSWLRHMPNLSPVSYFNVALGELPRKSLDE